MGLENHSALPAITEKLQGKRCTRVTAEKTELRLEFEDGTVLSIEGKSSVGGDSNWYTNTYVRVTGAGTIEMP
jgi:hypothetical protein